MIDVATGWSERAAVLGRSYRVMADGFQRCLARLPFPVLEIHPDNGTEFFNQHLVRFFRETVQGLQLSRSRPYHKNDNRNVEQKNATLVRAYLGYARLDSAAQTIALNHLYDQMRRYYKYYHVQPAAFGGPASTAHIRLSPLPPCTEGSRITSPRDLQARRGR